MQRHHSGQRPFFGFTIERDQSDDELHQVTMERDVSDESDDELHRVTIERDESDVSDDEVHQLMVQATIEESKREFEEGRLKNQYTSPHVSSGFEKLFQRQFHLEDDEFAWIQPGSSSLREGTKDVEEQPPFNLEFFDGYVDHGTSFEQTYRCYPASFIEKPQIESGDKIIMPPSALKRLASLHIDYPMLFFELRNAATERVSHCGVLEFIAEEGMIYMPYWMMENLLLREGDTVRVKNVTLPKGTYVKLQPFMKDFLHISNPKDIIETALRNFSCFTTGDTIMVAHKKKKYYLDIIETKPSNAINIIKADCEVDFVPPLDYKEHEKSLAAVPSGKTPSQAELAINDSADPIVQQVAASSPPVQTAQDLDQASSSTSKEKEEVQSTLAPTGSKPAFPFPLAPLEASGSIRSISDSASWSSSVKDRSRDLISLLSGRAHLHHPSSTSEISSMATVPTLEEVNGAFEALRTLLQRPAVEVFNTPADREQCRQLVIMLSSHHSSLGNRIILDDFSSRLPEYEKSYLAAVSTKNSAFAVRDRILPRVNELDTVLEQGKTSLSSLEYKLDELTERHDTLTKLIRKLKAGRDQVQASITETSIQLENLTGQVSSDYQAWGELQQQSIKAGRDMISSENTIAGVELAWSTLKRRLFPPSN